MLESGKSYLFRIHHANTIDNKTIIKDIYNKEYTIPAILEGEEIQLLYYNSRNNMPIFSQVSCNKTNYAHNQSIELSIISKEPIPDKNVLSLILSDNSSKLFNCSIPLGVENIIKDKKTLKVRIISILGEKIKVKCIENFNLLYDESTVYSLEIIDIEARYVQEKYRYTILLKGIHQETIKVQGQEWQYKNKAKLASIDVRLHKLPTGHLVFKQIHNTVFHPLFQIGKQYDFKFEKIIDPQTSLSAFQGIDGCTYYCHLPFTINKSIVEPGTYVKYYFKGIRSENGSLILKHFIHFEDIIKNYRALKRLAFDSIYNEAKTSDDTLLKKFSQDYDDRQNIWIISFCEIYRQKIKQILNAGDFETALIFIEVLILFEDWILKSGFLSTFTESKKIDTERAARSEISKYKNLLYCLEILLDNKQDIYFTEIITSQKNITENEYKQLIQLFWHLRISKKLNYQTLFNVFYKIGLQNESLLKERHLLHETLTLLDKIKSELEKEITLRVFISSKERNTYYQTNKLVESAIKLNLLISKILIESKKSRQEIFISLARVLKFSSFYSTELYVQLTNIKTAIFILKNNSTLISSFEEFNITWDNIFFDPIGLVNRIAATLNKSNTKIEHYFDYSMYTKNSVYNGTVIGKNEIGYEIKHQETIFTLPYFSTNRFYQKEENIEFTVSNYAEKFGLAFVTENKRLLSDDKILSFEELHIGKVIKAKVTEIHEKHVKFNIGLINGVMLISEISNQFVEHPSALLKVGDIIDVKVIEIENRDNYKVCRLSRKAVLLEKNKNIENLKDKSLSGVITKVNGDNNILLELQGGHSSFIPKRNLSWNNIISIPEIFSIGDRLEVIIKHISADGRICATNLTTKNPFINSGSYTGKKYKANIIGLYDFSYWLKLYDQAQQVESSEPMYFRCPKCHIDSNYKIDINKSQYTSKNTIAINEAKNAWRCINCKWEGEDLLMLWVPDLNSTAALRLNKYNQTEKETLLNKINHKSTCTIKIIDIYENKRYIFVDIEQDSISDPNQKIYQESDDVQLLGEIASCLEHFAFLSDNYRERITYLNFSKMYYGVARSPKSYYLNAYIDFTEIINKLESSDLDEKDVTVFKKEIKKTIDEIESKELSVEVFPIIGTIITILRTLLTFKSNDENDINYLLKIYTDHLNDDYNIKELTRILLIQLLIAEEESQPLIDLFNNRLIAILKQTLTLFEDSEIDHDDLNNQRLIFKLLSKGETIDTEFKASLDCPVLSKSQKKHLSLLKKELLKAIELGNTINAKKIEEEIKQCELIENSNPRIVKEINFTVIKTIAAFANTEGGILLIGVDEDENDKPFIKGIEPDLLKLKSKDGIKLKFDNLVQTYLLDSFNTLIERFNFITISGKDVLLIKIKPTVDPVFVKKPLEEGSTFFIRKQASTVALTPEDLYTYLKTRSLV